MSILTIRHSLSHLMSMAIMEKYPKAGLGVGPAIENGFYQDYDLPEAISEKDFVWIEKRIRQLIAKKISFVKVESDFASALKFYKHDPYKTEMINELKAKGKKKLSFYDSDWFHNLCGGPHVQNTSEINPNSFKLDKIAGAYWRGDEKQPMLQRIYGLAFESKEKLKEYLKNREEAEKRDHRKIGKELELFALADEVGAGLPLILPKGTVIWEELNRYRQEEQKKRGYLGVHTPHIAKLNLYKTSGHWQNYRDNMYPSMKIDREEYILKPMNCPHHIMIYQTKTRSYRDLPIRLAELGTVYRYEKSGEVGGLTRVRSITQDDAHIFCRPDQVRAEFEDVIDYVLQYLKVLKFENFRARLGVRDPQNKKYIGEDNLWKKAEKDIKAAAEKMGLKYVKEEGEAAFYGPKLDFIVSDTLGREWQLGTIQVDYNLPERFGLEYISEQGKACRPVMIHRAPFGAMERFIGILIEHYAGAFPLWLAPVQAVIIPVSEKFEKYGQKIYEDLRKNNIRVEIDNSSESVSKRIRNSELQKVPYILVVGEKEEKDGTLAVRERNKKEVYSTIVDEFIKELNNKITTRV